LVLNLKVIDRLRLFNLARGNRRSAKRAELDAHYYLDDGSRSIDVESLFYERNAKPCEKIE
jgi:hypothetical protein